MKRRDYGQQQVSGWASKSSAKDELKMKLLARGGLIWYQVPWQVIAPEETRVGVSSHKLCNRGTTAMFDIHIINLDSGSYLRMILQKVLAKAEKDNK